MTVKAKENSMSLIYGDPDWIALKRFDYSLAALLERYPEGCPRKVIASALMVNEDEVQELYEEAISELRTLMGITL